MLNNIFQQVVSEKKLKQRVISITSMLVQQQQLHKILDNFFHKGLIEEMTSYDNPHSVLEIHPLPLTRLNSTTQPIYLF